MNIAYLISAHNDPKQLQRLVEALGDNAWCFIHIDKKSDITPFIEALSKFPEDRIHFLKNRTDVRWGTILEVEYQMNMLKAALDYSESLKAKPQKSSGDEETTFKGFDRYISLSGLDYPIKPSLLASDATFDPSKEYLMGIDMSNSLVHPRHTSIYRHPRPFFKIPFLSNKSNQNLSIICRKSLYTLRVQKPLILPNNWHMYKGAAWWAITETLASYIYETYATTPLIKKYFMNSFGQAETLIPTIAFNSPYAKRCLEITGDYPGLKALTPLTYIDYNPVIKILTEKDIPTLMESGKLFCRKVISGKSDNLVKHLAAL